MTNDCLDSILNVTDVDRASEHSFPDSDNEVDGLGRIAGIDGEEDRNMVDNLSLHLQLLPKFIVC